MNPMIKYIIILLLIGACAPKFNSVEYLLLSKMKMNAANSKALCNTDINSAMNGIKQIHEDAQLFSIYTEHLHYESDINRSANYLLNMMEHTRQSTSQTYCEAKFSDLLLAIDRIMTTLSKEEN